MKTVTRYLQNLKGLTPLLFVGIIFLSSCTEGLINKTKYEGEKIKNTCDTFSEEVGNLVASNSNTTQLVVAEYDNSEFDYYYLDPGQYEIKDGMLNFRLAQDLEYGKYCQKGVAIHVTAKYTSLDHLADMENPSSGDIGMLVIDEDYYSTHKDPFFLYQIPVPDDAVNGKQIALEFSVVKYKKGKVKKVFCNTVEVPLGPIAPSCCNFQPWESAKLQSVISMPEVTIPDENYRYRGFTGTLDLICPENKTTFDEDLLSKAITEYISKYEKVGYKITNIDMRGWASMGGKEDLNQRLSQRRAEAVYGALTKSIDPEKVQISYAGMGEDWDRFKQLVKTSALSGQQQNAALQIANSGGTNDEKEAEMRKLDFWEELVEQVIINTRHTFTTFKFDYQPDKMYVEYYPSEMPVVSDELYNVATKSMIVSKWNQGADVKKGLKVLDILIGNNKKANLYAMRSTYHFGGKDVSKAISDIEQALNLDRNNVQYALAGLAYKTTNADNYSLSERMGMMKMYNDYATKYPDNTGLLFNRAVMMDKVGYISGAMAEYGELLEGNDPTAAALNNRGVAKLKTNRLTEAEMDFKAAAKKDAKMAEPNFNLAVIYAVRGLTNQTVEHLDKAIAANPEMKKMIFSNGAFSVMKDTKKFDKYR